MIILRFMTFSAFLFGFAGFSQGLASENLRFDAPVSLSSLKKLELHISQTLEQSISAFEVAPTDLNGDGLYEFILRSKDCQQALQCRFIVFGETDEGVLLLGEMTGHNVLLGNDSSYGVRNLLIYSNAVNDYDYELLRWDPRHSEYRKAGL